MNRYLKYGIAFLRGRVYRLGVLVNPKITLGNHLMLFSHVEICARKLGTVEIGENVRIGGHSVISALNGGTISIGDNASIGDNCNIVSHQAISIGNGTITAHNVNIYDHDHKFDSISGVKRKEFNTSSVSIGSNCWIGANVTILRGTEIGNNCVVGAGCVLKGKYPDGVIITQPRDTIIREIL